MSRRQAAGKSDELNPDSTTNHWKVTAPRFTGAARVMGVPVLDVSREQAPDVLWDLVKGS